MSRPAARPSHPGLVRHREEDAASKRIAHMPKALGDRGLHLLLDSQSRGAAEAWVLEVDLARRPRLPSTAASSGADEHMVRAATPLQGIKACRGAQAIEEGMETRRGVGSIPWLGAPERPLPPCLLLCAVHRHKEKARRLGMKRPARMMAHALGEDFAKAPLVSGCQGEVSVEDDGQVDTTPMYDVLARLTIRLREIVDVHEPWAHAGFCSGHVLHSHTHCGSTNKYIYNDARLCSRARSTTGAASFSVSLRGLSQPPEPPEGMRGDTPRAPRCARRTPIYPTLKACGTSGPTIGALL
jgi:hypothetical protein